MTLLVLLVIFAGSYVLLPVSATVIVRDNMKSNLVSNKLFAFDYNKNTHNFCFVVSQC